MMLKLSKFVCPKLSLQYGISAGIRTFGNYLNESNRTEVPSSARVVICGGGVQGAAVAYYLAEMGWGKDTVLLEQGKLGGGSPWHMSGLVGIVKPTHMESLLTQESIQLYRELTANGHGTGFKQCGSLLLARTRDRMTDFRRIKANSVSRQVECHMLSREDLRQQYPLLKSDDLFGGIWIPGDGVADPLEVCMTLVKLAKEKGVRVMEGVQVAEVHSQAGAVSRVITDHGAVACQYFVNCGGYWSRALGKRCTPPVRVPVQACEHYYLHTKPLEGTNVPFDPNLPVIRDLDGHVYLRVKDGGYMVGGFEPTAKPLFEDGLLPASAAEHELAPDWDHFGPLLEQLIHRVPSLGDAILDKLCNAPEAFSPDCKWVVGEAPEVDGYFVATGMKSVGVASAGGVGRMLAHWIINGEPPYPMYDLDLQRFLPLHNNRKFLLERMKEVPGSHYNIPYPHWEFRTGRKLRMSPVFPRLKAAGAVFGQIMGYERPAWYEPKPYQDSGTFDDDGTDQFRVAYTNTFMKPPWYKQAKMEYRACRESVAIADYSSFTKLEIKSPGLEVVDFLQYLCSNDVDIPVGGIIHTGMHNSKGGYENDCSLARIADNHYMMIAPSVQQTRCQAWLKRHAPYRGNINVTDVTSLYTALCILGPLSRALLSELTDNDLSPKAFPFFTVKELDIGQACGIRAMNLTHTGEMGWVLYVPNEFALHVYDKLIEHGQKYSLVHAGHYATRSLRIERFYAFWGQDLDTSTTPLECGRGFRVKFEKDIDFLGRDALLKQRESGVHRMYVQLLLEDHDSEIDAWPWGGETIYRNGKLVGRVTTAGYGFTIARQVCLGFVQNIDDSGMLQKVTPEFIMSGQYEVDVAGLRFSARVSLRSPTLPTKFREHGGEQYVATRHGGGGFAS